MNINTAYFSIYIASIVTALLCLWIVFGKRSQIHYSPIKLSMSPKSAPETWGAYCFMGKTGHIRISVMLFHKRLNRHDPPAQQCGFHQRRHPIFNQPSKFDDFKYVVTLPEKWQHGWSIS